MLLDDSRATMDGGWTLYKKGTGKLCPFISYSESHYFGTTDKYRFKADKQAEIIREHRDTGLNIPTPSLVLLLRYFIDQYNHPTARILYAGIELNVAPGILLPFDTPRDFGWEEFKKSQKAFEKPDWPYTTSTTPPTLKELRLLPHTICTLNSF